MQRAGAATAAEIALRQADALRDGALIFAGPGNNGGDAWVVARALAATGTPVRVCEPIPASTQDAQAERTLALQAGVTVLAQDTHLGAGDSYRGEGVVVDGLLGTGASGAPRGPIGAALAELRAVSARRALLVAIDLPTGVDATTGQAFRPARPDLTFTYGTLKRGHLVARGHCGRIVVLDIGLGAHAVLEDGAPAIVSRPWVAAHLPHIPADAHKGTRKKLAIVGGGAGMTGATILAARGAWRSGVGMVKLVARRESLPDIREAEPQSLTAPWPESVADVERDITKWADAVLIGPGLGAGTAIRALVDRVLAGFKGPVVADADALNAFSGDVNALARALDGRPSILTPHPVEFARITGSAVDDVLANRFDVAVPLARHTRAVVLLKGQPTVISAPSGERMVSASGTPLLAAAGSGDVLAGMVGTLLAQTNDPFAAASAGAWVHGRAAWLAQRGRGIRGLALDDVMAQLARAWSVRAVPTRAPVLFELPDVLPDRRGAAQ